MTVSGHGAPTPCSRRDRRQPDWAVNRGTAHLGRPGRARARASWRCPGRAGRRHRPRRAFQTS